MVSMGAGLREAVHLILTADPQVMDAAGRSLAISIIAVCMAGLVGIPIGCLLSYPFPGRNVLLLTARVGMSVPTVFIGLVCYGMFSRNGPLGAFDLLYTPTAIVVGEFFLALPILATWTHTGVSQLDPRVHETATTLGAGAWRRFWTLLSEARPAVAMATLTAFSRCFTELGIAMMAGGNLKYRTRTLTTTTALETARGDFERGAATSLILLGIAVALTAAIVWFGRQEVER